MTTCGGLKLAKCEIEREDGAAEGKCGRQGGTSDAFSSIWGCKRSVGWLPEDGRPHVWEPLRCRGCLAPHRWLPMAVGLDVGVAEMKAGRAEDAGKRALKNHCTR